MSPFRRKNTVTVATHSVESESKILLPRAKKRGLPQLGTLGAGNHYAEIQVVDEIFDKFAAGRMGIDRKGQVLLFFLASKSF